jgi:hypothetical protein
VRRNPATGRSRHRRRQMGVLDDGATGIIRTLCHLHTGIAKAPLYAMVRII